MAGARVEENGAGLDNKEWMTLLALCSRSRKRPVFSGLKCTRREQTRSGLASSIVLRNLIMLKRLKESLSPTLFK